MYKCKNNSLEPAWNDFHVQIQINYTWNRSSYMYTCKCRLYTIQLDLDPIVLCVYNLTLPGPDCPTYKCIGTRPKTVPWTNEIGLESS